MTSPIKLDPVSPGGLITAHGWTAMSDAIEELDVRLRALEAGGPTPTPSPGAPVLNNRTPTGDVHPHDLVTLLGQNFLPLSQTRVHFGSAPPITSFGAGSDDTHLSFTVPSIAPQTAEITVSNPQGTSATKLMANVLAEVVPQGGNVDVQPDNDPLNPPTPVAGQPLQLQWIVTSNTLFSDTYSFDVQFTDKQPGGSNWTATLNTSERLIAAGASFTVVATVAVPANGTSANVTLKATSLTDPTHRRKAATPLALSVGNPTPTSDSRIGLTVSDPQPMFDMDGNPSNVTLIHENNLPVILVGKNAPGFVEMQVDFHDSAAIPPVNYRFFSQVEDTGHWSADTTNPATLVQTQLNGTTTVLFNLTNLATNANPNDTQFTVSAAKLKSDATDDYVSFAPISIRNQG
jgi:hypothetical protein